MEESRFIFPNYLVNPIPEEKIEFVYSKEELELYRAEMEFFRGKYSKAYELLRQFLVKAKDHTTKIGGTYFLCLTCFKLRRYSEFVKNWQRLKLFFRKEFPYKKELALLLHDVECYFSGNHFFLNEFQIDSRYSYHPSVRNYIKNLCAYIAVLNLFSGKSHESFITFEMICQEYDETDNYYLSMYMHLYLAHAAHYNRCDEDCMYHLKMALSIGKKYDIYRDFAYMYHYIPEKIEKVLCLPEFNDLGVIRKIGREHNEIFRGLLEYMGSYSTFGQLKENDLEYIVYATQGLTNKEIAEMKHLSVSTVSKKYSDIYQRTFIKSKKELALLSVHLFDDYQNKEVKR